MPRVSIITGFHNRGEHLESTVRSILEQTYRDFELIVFDDASNDNTAALLRTLSEKLKDDRLKTIIHEKNLGFTRGMIDAVAEARGEFIAVQGSGDRSLPRRIELQVAYLDEHPKVVAVGCWYTNIVASSGVRRARTPVAEETTFDALTRENVFSHGEVMFRRSAYDAAGGYRAAFVNSQDLDLWLRMIGQGRFGTVKEQLYERYVRMDGVSYEPKKFAVQARYTILACRIAQMNQADADAMLQRLSAVGPVAIIPKEDPELQKFYRQAAARSIVWGHFKEAADLAREAIANPVYGAGFIAATRFFQSVPGRPVLRLLRSYFKVR